MDKVFLICGKLCSGKTTYAQQLQRESGAVILSVDEIMLALFGPYTGEKHDEYARRAQVYLMDLAARLVPGGVSVILDWGFWSAGSRREAREYFSHRGICSELHCIDIPEAERKIRVEKRNREVRDGSCTAYPVDSNLDQKAASLFEPPLPAEVDVWIRC